MKYLLAILLLSSCSAKWHYDKACKKDAVYCATHFQLDTFVVRDTFTYHRVDTTNMVDTITIDTGGIYFRIIRDHDVIQTTIRQKPDTSYLTITKTMPPKIVYRDKTNWWWLILIPLLLWLIYKK